MALDRFRAEAAARLRDLWRPLKRRDQEALRAMRAGIPATRPRLRMRGLVTEEGSPFGEVLADWLREEEP